MKPVRRIVTGHLADGRSTVLMDSAAPNVRQRKAGNGSTLVWVTEESPASLINMSSTWRRSRSASPTPG